MLYWTLTFLVIAIVAGLLGFGFIQFAFVTAAKIAFFLFVVLFIVSLISGFTRRTG